MRPIGNLLYRALLPYCPTSEVWLIWPTVWRAYVLIGRIKDGSMNSVASLLMSCGPWPARWEDRHERSLLSDSGMAPVADSGIAAGWIPMHHAWMWWNGSSDRGSHRQSPGRWCRCAGQPADVVRPMRRTGEGDDIGRSTWRWSRPEGHRMRRCRDPARPWALVGWW
jgi:hypothetical protein